MGLEDLKQVMAGIEGYDDENIIADFQTSEDSGVYRLSEDLALVESVDFITPVVDDPYLYGQIAVANALSDIFAMGAVAKTAMNVLMWDQVHISPEMLREILQGGSDKLKEAKVALLGGHSVMDTEQKYGLSVSGIVHPKKVWRNCGAKVGDALILTKPLGSGILTTALKNDVLPLSQELEGIVAMQTLNQRASEIAKAFQINACTDVTGFGLIGHLLEMCAHTKSVRLEVAQIPLMELVPDLIAKKMIPNGSAQNLKHLRKFVREEGDFKNYLALFDSQTSGGLLFALPKNQAPLLVDQLRLGGYERSAVIGEFVPLADKSVILG